MTPGKWGLDATLFRVLLSLFPPWFRERYGRDMLESFRAGAIDARRGSGTLSYLRFVASSFLQVIPAALSVRREYADPDRRTGSRLRRERWSDLGQAVRSLRRSPGWTGAALLILTLGIGGTTAVFSVLNAVLLRPLPYHEPDRLVSMWSVNLRQNLPDGSSWENASDWKDRGTALEDLALVFRPEFTASTVTSFGEPERIHVGWVSPNFFQFLGTPAVSGRTFGPGDLEADERVVVIDEGLWGTRYGRDPAAVGRSMTIDGEEYRIVGVVPREVTIPLRETQVWRLFDVRTPDDNDWRGFDGYWVLGRMRAEADLGSTQRELTAIASQLAAEYPATNRNRSVSVTTLRAEIVGDQLPLVLWTLLGSMVLVLLVGGTNVAQLMLGRGIERRRELAVRSALGATRARINRQLILEGALLSVAAGVGGVVAAGIGRSALVALIPPDVPLIDTVRIDWMVLLAAIAVSAVLAPLVGMLPALAGSRSDASAILASGGRGSTDRNRRARSILVVAEVAMAVILLGGAGLLIRSAWELSGVDPGLDADRTLMTRIDLSPVDEGEDLGPVLEEILARVQGLPMVRGAGAIGQFFVERIPDQTITLVGSAPRESSEPTPQLTTDAVYPGFFEAMGVPLLRGRHLQPTDIGDPGRPERVVVNRAWVRAFSPDRDPIGREFRWGDQVQGPTMRVVGVVADLSRTTLEESVYPQMFAAGPVPGLDLMVRSSEGSSQLATAIRGIVAEADPGAAISELSTVRDRYDGGLAPRRFQTFLFGVFAAFATLLAAIGLFATLHDAVASRRREIGVRIALGASPSSVRRLVLVRGAGLSVIGLLLGIVTIVLLSEISRRFVYGISPTDPSTLAAVSAMVLFVTVLASVLPLRQATSVSPAEVLSVD